LGLYHISSPVLSMPVDDVPLNDNKVKEKQGCDSVIHE
jgi:hypothetical protein